MTKLSHQSLGPRSPARDGLNPHHIDYLPSGERLKQQLIRHAGLRPESHVLDIGCGTGRLAQALYTYLKGGTYHGIDLNHRFIDHCRRTNRFRKGFSFSRLDYYHPEWAASNRAQPYRLTLADMPNGSLDLVVLMGVVYYYDFHGAADIIHEAAPLLKSYGSMTLTARLLNHHSMAHLGADRYPLRGAKEWEGEPSRPRLDVALPEEGFRRIMLKSRLQIREPIRYGDWCTGGDLPDLVTAVRV